MLKDIVIRPKFLIIMQQLMVMLAAELSLTLQAAACSSH